MLSDGCLFHNNKLVPAAGTLAVPTEPVNTNDAVLLVTVVNWGNNLAFVAAVKVEPEAIINARTPLESYPEANVKGTSTRV